MIRRLFVGSLMVAAAFMAGCTKVDRQPVAANQSQANGAEYLLADEPSGAKSVTELRKSAKDGDDVVVVGRIGGDKNPWIEGKAGFWIVDGTFKTCSEREGDSCPTPWDYCCESPDELAKGMLTVKFVDGQGKTINADARTLLGVKELATVVVRGKAKRDADGNLVVLASKLYRRPNPTK